MLRQDEYGVAQLGNGLRRNNCILNDVLVDGVTVIDCGAIHRPIVLL